MTGSWEFWVIILVILVLFGGSAIPKFARNLARAKKEFEAGLHEGNTSAKQNDAADSSPAQSADKSDSSAGQ